jgi:hypothetical protein
MTTTDNTSPHPVSIAEGMDAHGDALGIIRRCPLCARYVCRVCAEPVPKRHKVIWTATGCVVCLRCGDHRAREAHAICYPDCPESWHDMWDHGNTFATTGGLRRVIAEGCAT